MLLLTLTLLWRVDVVERTSEVLGEDRRGLFSF
jgi:hypothetical protein